MVTRIAHICIGALDLEQTRKFYCDGLGVKVKFTFRKAGEIAGYYLDAGNGSFIEMFTQSAQEAGGRQPIRHVCLEVDDIVATAAQLKKTGIRVSDRTMGCDNSWQAWADDPNGVRIELHEYTKDSSQHTGRDCEIT